MPRGRLFYLQFQDWSYSIPPPNPCYSCAISIFLACNSCYELEIQIIEIPEVPIWGRGNDMREIMADSSLHIQLSSLSDLLSVRVSEGDYRAWYWNKNKMG